MEMNESMSKQGEIELWKRDYVERLKENLSATEELNCLRALKLIEWMEEGLKQWPRRPKEGQPENMLEAHSIILDWLQYTEHGQPFDEDKAEITLTYLSWLRKQNRSLADALKRIHECVWEVGSDKGHVIAYMKKTALEGLDGKI